ncbi:MAG TPA: FixH family protein [Arenibaculum sp.]|nr:FixH family protein [Arenibaculum sp.]
MKRILAGALFLVLAAPAAAEPLEADIRCRPAGTGPVYDCAITLADPGTGSPVSDAQFTVGADMPSMPMAHNVRPVAAVPAGEPGTYHARLALEMHGTWTVKLLVSAPVQARIHRSLDFFD